MVEIDMPEEMREKLAAIALKEHRYLSQQVCFILQKWLDNQGVVDDLNKSYQNRSFDVESNQEWDSEYQL